MSCYWPQKLRRLFLEVREKFGHSPFLFNSFHPCWDCQLAPAPVAFEFNKNMRKPIYFINKFLSCYKTINWERNKNKQQLYLVWLNFDITWSSGLLLKLYKITLEIAKVLIFYFETKSLLNFSFIVFLVWYFFFEVQSEIIHLD